jgi:O-antigen ligase
MSGDKMQIDRLRRHLVTLSSGHLVVWMVIGSSTLVLALLPLASLAHLLGWGLAIVLALVEPVFGLYWAVLSVPVQELATLPGGVSYTQAAMLLAGGAWGLRVLAHPERRIRWGRLLPYWAALLGALLLATVFTPYSRGEALKETLRWIEVFLIWLLAVNTLRRPWHVAGLVVCLLLAPAADAALGLVQFASGDGPSSFRLAAGSPFVRAYGTIGQPNSFAGYLNMAWPLALALALAPWRRATNDQRRTMNERSLFALRDLSFARWSIAASLWLATALLLAGLAVSFSRGGWVGAAIGLLAMALLVRRARRWLVPALAAGALVLALGGLGVLPGVVAERLASITRSVALFDAGSVQVTDENFAVVERMAQIQAGWRMFVAHPLIGVGPGNYTPAYPDFAVLPWYASRGHAHNYYVQIAAEAGLPGLLAYLALLAGIVGCAGLALRRADSIERRSLALGCCGIIATTAGHNLFENLHVLSMGIQLAAVWGLLAVLGDWELMI